MIYEIRKRESYLREKYTYKIDIRPELIISDQAINNHKASM